VIAELDCNATSASSASIFHACHVKGAIDINAVGPTIQYNGGRFMVDPTGAGVAGFTNDVGHGS